MPKTTSQPKPRHNLPWTRAEIEEAYALWATGTLDVAAKHFGLSRQRIYQVVTEAGLGNPKKGSGPAPTTRRCSMCGVDYVPSHYGEHCLEAGHKKNKGGRPVGTDKLYDAYIVEAYQRGDRIGDISVATGSMPFFSIYRILRRNGIEPNRGGGHYVRDARFRASRAENRNRRKLGLPVINTHAWRATRVVEPYRHRYGGTHGTSTEQERPGHPPSEG